jgi:6-phosphofructokinase 1
MTLQAGQRLALLTSGGDAPGMNSALRAATKVALEFGLEVFGVEDGYAGLMAGAIKPMPLRELDDAARRGGTILGTARSAEFRTPEGRSKALQTIAHHKLDALLVVGGNGSLTGALTLANDPEAKGKLIVAGIPASIDNDLAGTSMSIGVDTALNTIVAACDRICDTAAAHRRTFFVEVMGRDCGYLAMTAGVAAGADVVLVPEINKSEEDILQQLVRAIKRAFGKDAQKRRVLVIKSEGVNVDMNIVKLRVDEQIRSVLPDVDTRVTVLGHVVRGGTPTAFDRLLAARLAYASVRALVEGQHSFMAGWVGPGVVHSPCAYDPYVVLSPLTYVLSETELLMTGQSPLAQWRKRIFQEVESILER